MEWGQQLSREKHLQKNNVKDAQSQLERNVFRENSVIYATADGEDILRYRRVIMQAAPPPRRYRKEIQAQESTTNIESCYIEQRNGEGAR